MENSGLSANAEELTHWQFQQGVLLSALEVIKNFPPEIARAYLKGAIDASQDEDTKESLRYFRKKAKLDNAQAQATAKAAANAGEN